VGSSKRREKKKTVFVVKMGGGPKHPFPAWVWSPTGGSWNDTNPNWRRNTIVALAFVGASAYAVFKVSSAHEVCFFLFFFFSFFFSFVFVCELTMMFTYHTLDGKQHESIFLRSSEFARKRKKQKQEEKSTKEEEN
jgi:hypothetical protein